MAQTPTMLAHPQLDLFPDDSGHLAMVPADARLRTVATAHGRIPFTLRRSRRKSIGLAIDAQHLRVTAPHWVSLAQIDAVVMQRAHWVVEKLAQQRQRSRMAQPTKPGAIPGANHPPVARGA